jgi:hypothetical protein
MAGRKLLSLICKLITLDMTRVYGKDLLMMRLQAHLGHDPQMEIRFTHDGSLVRLTLEMI